MFNGQLQKKNNEKSVDEPVLSAWSKYEKKTLTKTISDEKYSRRKYV